MVFSIQKILNFTFKYWYKFLNCRNLRETYRMDASSWLLNFLSVYTLWNRTTALALFSRYTCIISNINTRRKPCVVWQMCPWLSLTSEEGKWVVWFLGWEVNCILEKDKNEKLFSDGFVSLHYKFFEDSCHESLWEFEKYIFI